MSDLIDKLIGVAVAVIVYFSIFAAIVTAVATTVATVEYPEGCAIPTSGGISTVDYSGVAFPFGMPVSSRERYSYISTTSTTTSTSYGNLADTAAHAVTVYVGRSGTAQITFTARLSHSVGNGYAYIGVAVSGATTLAAGAPYETYYQQYLGGAEEKRTYSVLMTGLKQGSNTFTLNYKLAVAGTLSVLARELSVLPL